MFELTAQPLFVEAFPQEVDGVMHSFLKTHFALDEFTLRRLVAVDEKFAAICEDFCDALEAEQHWKAKGELGLARSREYARIASELEEEITHAIARLWPSSE